MTERSRHFPQASKDRLRAAAIRNRPWEHSTGPRTTGGKARSRMNALKHGRETAERRAFRLKAMRFLRLEEEFRRAINGWDLLDDPARVVFELSRLARVLEAAGVTSRPRE